MNNEQPIIIALDYSTAEEAESLLSAWDGHTKPWIKVGYQLFYAVGPAWVAEKKEAGYSIFLDLKLHDIPNTVAGALRSLRALGVDLLTLHASGGTEMMQAAREMAKDGGPRLLAVTQLTSTSQAMLNQELQIAGTVGDSVARLARLADQAGMDGVICSGQEVAMVKAATRSDFLAVTPGIRPLGIQSQDQKRVVTPKQAIEWGADYLVVGRPITAAANPYEAYRQIVTEVKQAKENGK